MKTHTTAGKEIIEEAMDLVSTDSGYLNEAKNLAAYHHEKWNGKGYPKGLKGEEIPLEARILTIADVFDALCVFRVYKKAWPTSEAYAYILEESGQSFDPRCVEAFKKIYPSVRKLYAHLSVNQVGASTEKQEPVPHKHKPTPPNKLS